MMKPRILLGCVLLVTSVGHAVPLNEIVVNFAARAETEPTLDGRLDDHAWSAAPVHTRFYEYYKAHPKLSLLRSEMRLLYDDTALWIGLTHFEDAIGNLKVVATARDTVDWLEDMSEIYVDPFGDAIGFTKLLVNSVGVIGDVRRVDASVMLNEWSGDGWQAKTSVGTDRWCIEIRLPYADLQRPPTPGGALWRLCVTRYQWTSGRFVGSVSSPGGAYNNTAGFGYLYFLPPGASPDVAVLTAALNGRVAPPWCTSLGETILVDVGNGVQVRQERLEDFLAREEKADRERIESFRRKLEQEFGGRK